MICPVAIVIVPGLSGGLNGGVDSPGKIMVVRGGAVGDFIVTLPILAALRQSWPGARLEVVAQSNVAPLAEAGGLADAWWPLESRAIASFFSRDGELDAGMKQVFAASALVVSFLSDPDAVFRENVTRCGIGNWIQGPSRIDARGTVHATQQLMQALDGLGVTASEIEFRLKLPVSHRAGKWVAVHPGSGSERKNWPVENWADLLAWLANETEFNALLIGGEADGDKVQRLAAKLPCDRIELAEHLPLVELGGRMAGCVAFAGHDSGIAHLAAALGIAGVVLWGSSSPSVWQPAGLKILEHPEEVSAIDVRLARETLQDCLSGLS